MTNHLRHNINVIPEKKSKMKQPQMLFAIYKYTFFPDNFHFMNLATVEPHYDYTIKLTLKQNEICSKEELNSKEKKKAGGGVPI